MIAVECPIRLSGPHVPRAACGSGQGVIEEIIAAIPGGSFIEIEFSAWCPSGRLIVSVNGVKPSAWLFVVPASNPGLKGSGPFGHGEPFGPALIAKLEEGAVGAVPDHGVNEEVAV